MNASSISYMKKIGLILLIQCIAFSVFAQETAIKNAEAAYANEEYETAIELYETLLKEYGESSGIYYNLGNAYFKTGAVAKSILNYERALLLDPGDNDIRFNLQLARQRSVDKTEPAGDFFLVKWFKAIQNMGAADSWAKAGIVCFILFIGCLILFFFSRWILVKKIGFYLGIFLLVSIIFMNIFASNQKKEIVNRTEAIVFSPTVTIKSSPSAGGTDLFILHEGTKVSIKSSLGEWNEIETEEGSVGWMPKKDIEII